MTATERDGRMRHDDFFELARIDVVAAAKDHVFFAVDDREIAFVVHDADVAGVKPAVAKGFGGRLGAFVVALHHVCAANDDLAAFAARHLVVVVVKALDLDAEDRLADRSGFRRLFEMIESRERRRFGEAVAFHHADAESSPETPSSPRPASEHRPTCRPSYFRRSRLMS